MNWIFKTYLPWHYKGRVLTLTVPNDSFNKITWHTSYWVSDAIHIIIFIYNHNYMHKLKSSDVLIISPRFKLTKRQYFPIPPSTSDNGRVKKRILYTLIKVRCYFTLVTWPTKFKISVTTLSHSSVLVG